jgi:hypothetical protein
MGLRRTDVPPGNIFCASTESPAPAIVKLVSPSEPAAQARNQASPRRRIAPSAFRGVSIPHADELGIGGFCRTTLAIFADCVRFSDWEVRSGVSVHNGVGFRRSELVKPVAGFGRAIGRVHPANCIRQNAANGKTWQSRLAASRLTEVAEKSNPSAFWPNAGLSAGRRRTRKNGSPFFRLSWKGCVS